MSDADVALLVLTPVALVLTALLVAAVVRAARFLRTARRVPGEVVGADSSMSVSMGSRRGGSRDTYKAVLRFTLDGVEHTVTSGTSSSRPPTPGPTEVLVRPDDPSGARRPGFLENWLTTLIFAGLALPFDVALVVLLVVRLG